MLMTLLGLLMLGKLWEYIGHTTQPYKTSLPVMLIIQFFLIATG